MPSWQKSLSQMITHPQALLEEVGLVDKVTFCDKAIKHFPLRVTREFAARITPQDPFDPLLRQVLPISEELIVLPGYSSDPLQEKQANPHPGLLHKYANRVLLIATTSCAIHCRYCFRRDFPYTDNNPGRAGWQQALEYVQADPSIEEIILSGGDPLMMSDNQLAWFIQACENIPHLQRLRFHTRLPIVLPQRLTPTFIDLLSRSPLQPVIVIHCNHAQEIDASVKHYLQQVKAAGIPLLNQSVLLAGVNDSLEALKNLSTTLFAAGVMPYYLHLLDAVQGAAHFSVPLARARELHQALQHALSGYLVPKLVQELPGEKAKTWVF